MIDVSADRPRLENRHSPGGWLKSGYSNNGGDCVEVARFGTGSTVGIRDSKVQSPAVLSVPTPEFAAFLQGVRSGTLGP
ncbi:DUF397 domain-containing protein [Sphaerisporangium sp. NPDC005289]|uniref:DUF397 domain-containing protein n=1 Tax=Sphaerisporangium sp. NPDC005289 TaxID=3155247 RepID=UPI0033A57A06